MKKSELFSTSFHAGNRTYFLDIKKTIDGDKYLKITESKRLGDNDFERHQIMIFEEVIEKFEASLGRAVKEIQSDNKAYSVTTIREKHANAYMPWSKKDDEKLELFFCEGKSVGELSIIFQRNKGAISSRIKKLELKEKYGR